MPQTPSIFIPRGLLFIWRTYGSAVSFKNGAVFNSARPPDFEESLDVLFGPGTSLHSVGKQIEAQSGKLAAGYVPIGSLRGGHLLCQSVDEKIWVWDSTIGKAAAMFAVASSFDGFFDSLRPQDA